MVAWTPWSLWAAFALILVVDGIAFAWFAYGWRRFRHAVPPLAA